MRITKTLTWGCMAHHSGKEENDSLKEKKKKTERGTEGGKWDKKDRQLVTQKKKTVSIGTRSRLNAIGRDQKKNMLEK